MPLRKLLYSEIKEAFQGMPYVYAITLNPDPKKELTLGIARLLRYFDKKGIQYWLSYCKSRNGYFHYHGIIRFQYVNIIDKQKLALRREINLLIGRFPSECLMPIQNLYGWYQYVRGDTNEFYEDKFNLALTPSSFECGTENDLELI